MGVPDGHWYGVEGDFYVMVIDLLGTSLEELFSVRTVLMLADQVGQNMSECDPV